MTHEAPRRAIPVATLFSRLTQLVYLLASIQLIVISTHDHTIISRDMISIIVIKRFINAQISTGNALIGVTSFSHLESTLIQFPINGIFVLSFTPLQSVVAMAFA